MCSDKNVQRFSSDWHANNFAGSTVSKITRGMSAFDTVTDTLTFNLAPALIVVIGVTVAFTLRWPLLGALTGLSIFLFVTVSVALSIRWVSPANRTASELHSKLSGALADSVSGNPTVKSFAAERREDVLFAQVSAKWARSSIVAWDRAAWTGLIQAIMLIGLQAAILVTGIFLWSQNQATPGDITSLLTTQFLVTSYLRDIAQRVRQIQRAMNDMDDVIDFYHADTVVDKPSAGHLLVERGAIRFDHIAFRYKGASRSIYDGFSLDIPAGQRVGLVGRSGSGKSTFVKLLQRLYDLDGGRILIDGQDICGVTQSSLREAVGLVPQDPVLFHRSLAENIAYGRPGASLDDIREAARLAYASEFIEVLPQGYDTLVGERGIKLSGGERQRVAIARAILANTPILVLDEATSSLDSLSEQFIRQAIERISAAGRTTIVIAHRLSTVQHLDRILVFDHGQVVEDGTHEQLIELPNGVYHQLLRTM